MIILEGFEQFIRRLSKSKQVTKEELDQALEEAGKLLMKNAAQETPVVEGRLRASYEMRPWQGREEWVFERTGDLTLNAGTKVYYARWVEEGHPLVKGRRKSTRRVIGFVKGKFYFRKAFERTEREAPKLLKDRLRKIGRELGFDVEG